MKKSKTEKSNNIFIKTAVEIGDHLVATSIWDEEKVHCTWLGARDINDSQIAKYSNRTSALSPEFYSGTAGISLFLVELYHLTKNRSYLDTALGAWLRSFRYMQINDFPASSISFYAGELGLIFVGYRFLEIDPDLSKHIMPQMNLLISKLDTGLKVKHSLDVIGGNSGAIPALLALKEKYGLDVFEKTALDCSQELLDNGNWIEDMCVWSSPKVHGVELDTPPTTGYSHGASGIAVGLLEMYRYTNNKKYLTAGRGAFAFENSLFNREEGNWIDTRYPHKKKNNGLITGTYRYAWCHGAPGIALANLRASVLDEERKEFHLNLASIAIETTKRSIRDRINENPEKDATLCHGILGSLDIVYSYAKKVDNEKLISFVRETSAEYISKFDSVVAMPSGIVAGGYNPSIMVGHSGIGLHCLRLYSEDYIMSPLMPIL